MPGGSRDGGGDPFSHPYEWIQWDISNEAAIADIALYIKQRGGASYVVHLAGYYDFDYDEKPEYYRTNVLGTKNVLELSRLLGVQAFYFCKFPGCLFLWSAQR